MKPNKLIGLVAVGLILPSTAVAFGNPVLAEVRVKTANVEAVTRNNGNIYVNTGTRHHIFRPCSGKLSYPTHLFPNTLVQSNSQLSSLQIVEEERTYQITASLPLLPSHCD